MNMSKQKHPTFRMEHHILNTDDSKRQQIMNELLRILTEPKQQEANNSGNHSVRKEIH
jgi:hypothetical protein